MTKVKVIWNVVGFVKGSEVEISENVFKAYSEKYFEKVEREDRWNTQMKADEKGKVEIDPETSSGWQKEKKKK